MIYEKLYSLALKKISKVDLKTENLSTKIDEGNQAIGTFRFENTTFVKNVKTLDIELSKAHS